jgi:phosphoglycolate phosphatase
MSTKGIIKNNTENKTQQIHNIYCKPKIVLFDWDNTLVTTKNLFSKVLAITLERLNISQELFQTKEFQNTRNMSVRDSFPIMFGDNWKEIWQKYEECYKELLDGKNNITMFEGAKDFLNRLCNDGVLLGIVSNKHHDLLLNEVDILGVSNFFKSIVGSGKSIADKPSAAHAIHAIDEIKANLASQSIYDINIIEECWLVGDSSIDVSCAVNTRCIPILFGNEVGHILSKQYLSKQNIKHIVAEDFYILQKTYNAIPHSS